MGIEQERAQGWRDAVQANLDAELSDLPAMMGVMDATDEAAAYGVEGERVEFEESGVINGAMKELIDRVVESGRSAIITKSARMVAMIVPMTVDELVRRRFENDPELKAQIEAALAEGTDNPISASELFNKTGELEE